MLLLFLERSKGASTEELAIWETICWQMQSDSDWHCLGTDY